MEMENGGAEAAGEGCSGGGQGYGQGMAGCRGGKESS
jgi:hypothetical protein